MNLQQAFHDGQYTRFTRLDNGEVENWELYVNLVDWHFKSATPFTGCSISIPSTSVCLPRSSFLPVSSFGRGSTNSPGGATT